MSILAPAVARASYRDAERPGGRPGLAPTRWKTICTDNDGLNFTILLLGLAMRRSTSVLSFHPYGRDKNTGCWPNGNPCCARFASNPNVHGLARLLCGSLVKRQEPGVPGVGSLPSLRAHFGCQTRRWHLPAPLYDFWHNLQRHLYAARIRQRAPNSWNDNYH